MQSVMNVLVNRAQVRGTDVFTEATRKLQFSSLTDPGDPQLIEYPHEGDPDWTVALTIAYQAKTGSLEDITGGATSYYALSMKEPPYWVASMTKTVDIEGQRFFK